MPTRVDMNLMLVADRTEGTNRMRYSVSDAAFFESDDKGVVELRTSDFKPPVFPTNLAMQGVGALVTVLVKVDAEGRVQRAVVSDVDLYATSVTSQRSAEAKVRRFAEATLAVVHEWTLCDTCVAENGSAVIPVNFAMPGTGSMAWAPLLPMSASHDEWTARTLAEARATSASGRATTGVVELLTPLDAAVNPAGEERQASRSNP